ncbi:MAG: DUF429 domain-containing protein [Pseudomonadota bacterium]
MIPPASPRVIVLSSHVAASAVGGGVTSAVLRADGFDPVLVPTVTLGRHPGRGAPGGGPVATAILEGMLAGLRAEGVDAQAAGLLTGYFASAEQVAAAARFIDEARAVNPSLRVMVDPILGDHRTDGAGQLYVGEDVAAAIRDQLIARADYLTPNTFELGWLIDETLHASGTIETAAETLRRQARTDACVAVTSAPSRLGEPGEGELGVLVCEGSDARLFTRPPRAAVSNGVGDAFAAFWYADLIKGLPAERAAGRAEARVAQLLKCRDERGLAELPLRFEDLSRPVAPLPGRRPGANAPAWVLGLDGAKAGWVGVFLDLNGVEAPHARLFADFRSALDAPERAHIIAVDMPIGFCDAPEAEGSGRACERLARARLGARRSSIFASPLRDALPATDYRDALARNRAAGGPGLSRQSFHLFAKMREIDTIMTPALEGCVHESHPELVFTVLNGAPMAHNKKAAEGRAERLRVLTEAGLPLSLFEPHPLTRSQAAPDDLVDAGALALTAQRLAQGQALSLPDDPPRDRRGLRMAIFA